MNLILKFTTYSPLAFYSSLGHTKYPLINGVNISSWEYLARNLNNLSQLEANKPHTKNCQESLDYVYAKVSQINGVGANPTEGKRLFKKHFSELQRTMIYIGSPIHDYSTKYEKLGPNKFEVDVRVDEYWNSTGGFFLLGAVQKAQPNVVDKLSSMYETPYRNFKDFAVL